MPSSKEREFVQAGKQMGGPLKAIILPLSRIPFSFFSTRESKCHPNWLRECRGAGDRRRVICKKRDLHRQSRTKNTFWEGNESGGKRMQTRRHCMPFHWSDGGWATAGRLCDREDSGKSRVSLISSIHSCLYFIAYLFSFSFSHPHSLAQLCSLKGFRTDFSSLTAGDTDSADKHT
jgi:hypothetical protein